MADIGVYAILNPNADKICLIRLAPLSPSPSQTPRRLPLRRVYERG